MLEISDVNVFYNIKSESLFKSSQFHAVKNINLDIHKNSTIGLVGESGSGKSTVIRCLNALEHHQGGDINILGVTLDNNVHNVEMVRRDVGMVFQQFNLFPHLTILENLMLGPVRARKLPEAEARELAMNYLERVKIPEQLDKYPGQLSGGQQQRVAIARALCMAPKIMLFDEPTSALDPEMIAEVLDVITELAEAGMTMICVTHEMGFARQVADMMLFMDHGRIVEMAPPRRFFAAPETARCKLFLSQILRH